MNPRLPGVRTLTIKKEEVLYDIANLAFVIADIHGSADAHAVHQTFDIIEGQNRDRIERVLSMSVAIVREVLSRGSAEGNFNRLPSSLLPSDIIFKIRASCHFNGDLKSVMVILREIIHEYLVCRVLADWLSVTLPSLAGVWREKAALQLERLERLAVSLAQRGWRRLRLFP